MKNIIKDLEVVNYILETKNKVKINSKEILKNDIFLALKGKKNHGNSFINEALKNKAKYIITDKKIILKKDQKKVLLVKDTFNFLFKIAKKKRNNYKGKVIGITGSVGKTSVKENLKFFLSNEFNVSASIKSYNNLLGVLITLLNFDLKSDFAIFEIGTNNFNEIKKLTSLIAPHQTIITNIFPTHLENFINTRNIAKEKSDIFNTKLNRSIELAILPNSNNDESFLINKAIKKGVPKIITLGENSNSDYFIKKIKNKKKNLFNVNLQNHKNKLPITIGASQPHQVLNVIFCLIIFRFNNLNLKKFYKKAKNIPNIAGRGLEKNIYVAEKKIRFIDQSYNASPITMKNSITYFNDLKINKNTNKYLILGDMNELGLKSKIYHKEIIEYIISLNLKKVILCGNLFKSALNSFKIENRNIEYIKNKNEIFKFLIKKLHNNDTILIKCSNSSEVNHLAKTLLKNER